jgi:hypothetical protein
MARVMVADSLSSRAKGYLQVNRIDNVEVIYPDNTDLEIVTYDNAEGQLSGIAFQGRSKKPLWKFWFRRESDRKRRIDETIDDRKKWMERKEQDKKEKREFSHSLVEGDFLSSSWGYDQTNVDFYQVTRVIGKMVEIRQVASKVVKSRPPQDYVEPVKNRFTGSKMKKRVGVGDSVKVSSHSHARKWDGKPMYQTSSGWGH